MQQFDLVVERWSNTWTYDLRETAELSSTQGANTLDGPTIARIMGRVSSAPYEATEMGQVLGSGEIVGRVYVGEDGTFYVEWDQTAVCLVYDVA